jgi:hypothetical protein
MCGLLDEALPMFGRHAWTLRGARRDEADLYGWLEDRVKAIARESRLRLYELAGSFPEAPNVLAHPTWMRPIDPWSGMPSPRVLAELHVGIDRSRAAILMKRSAQAAAVLAPVAAPFALRDPLARLLLLTGFHDSPAETIQTWTVPFALELERREPMPLLLGGESLVVRPRRTVLAGDRLGELLAPRSARLPTVSPLARARAGARVA